MVPPAYSRRSASVSQIPGINKWRFFVPELADRIYRTRKHKTSCCKVCNCCRTIRYTSITHGLTLTRISLRSINKWPRRGEKSIISHQTYITNVFVIQSQLIPSLQTLTTHKPQAPAKPQRKITCGGKKHARPNVPR